MRCSWRWCLGGRIDCNSTANVRSTLQIGTTCKLAGGANYHAYVPRFAIVAIITALAAQGIA